jgi:hypothetical protein
MRDRIELPEGAPLDWVVQRIWAEGSGARHAGRPGEAPGFGIGVGDVRQRHRTHLPILRPQRLSASG